MAIDRRSERNFGRGARALRSGSASGLASGLSFGGLLGAVLGLLVLGCASRSPFRQEFVELRSDHFVLTSSLPAEDTMAFARHLEVFHAGVAALLGLKDEAGAPVPTPVYVFDDRSLGRPFAVEHEAAFLLDEVDAPVLVFRGGRDFEARVTPDMRHRYAHRMLRDRAKTELPLWYEEGVAQLARSIDENARGVVLGRIDPAWRNLVLDWRSGDLQGALQRFDLSDETAPARTRFEALTWGIAHALEFGEGPATGAPSKLAAYREKLARDGSAVRKDALAAIGLDGPALEKLVYTHLEKKRPQARLLEIRGMKTSHWRTTPLPLAESRARLADLALRLERPELALDYYEHALAKDPKHAAARIGRAVAAVQLGDPEVAASTFASTQLLPDAPSALLLAAGDAQRAIAATADSPGRRRDAVEAARARYAEALAGAQPDLRAALGMARTYLEVPEEDPAKAVEWLDRVRARRPGSLWLELWQARAEVRIGQARLARVRAKNVVSRTHDRALEEAARALIGTASSGD